MRCVVSILASILCSFLMIACGGRGLTSNSSTPTASPGNTASSNPPSTSSQPGSGTSGGSSAGSGSTSGSGTGSGTGSGSGTSSGSGGGSGPSTAPQSGFVEKKFSLPHAGGVVAADFNRDGHTDLLVYGSSLLVLLNNGSGDFGGTISTALPAPYTGTRQVELADFNLDGYVDVVACVTNTSMAGAAVVFMNDHSGKLIAGQVIPLPSGCQGVAAGDANRDGKPDIALTYYTGDFKTPTNIINTWFNDGTGHFGSSTTQTVMLTATQDSTRNPCRMAGAAGADFDGNGTLDLMLFGACQSNVITPGDVYLARGTGTGQYTLTQITESNSAIFKAPVIKDINGDGKPDVVYTQSLDGPHGSSSTDLVFAINNGLGVFNLATAASENAYAGDGSYLHAGSPFTGPNSAAEGYATSTCCSQPASYGVKLFTQIGSAPAQTFIYGQAPDGAAGGEVTGVVVADLDGNGTQDIAAVEQNTNQNANLHVHLNFNK